MSELANRAPTNFGSTANLPNYAKDADREYVGDPWTRQPKETSLAFSFFQKFLDLGEARTVAELARQEDHSQKTLYQWSKKHRWGERADAFDAVQDQLRLNRLRRRKIRAAEKHADDVAELQEVIMRPANKLRERIQEMMEGERTDWLDTISDPDLERLVSALGQQLPALQKAEREALSSVADVPIRDNRAKMKGAILKRILDNKTMQGMVEETVFIVEEEEPEPSDD